jgi:hypothetical protein
MGNRAARQHCSPIANQRHSSSHGRSIPPFTTALPAQTQQHALNLLHTPRPAPDSRTETQLLQGRRQWVHLLDVVDR